MSIGPATRGSENDATGRAERRARVVTVAAVQLPGCGVDLDANAQVAADGLERAASMGAEIAVLPELALWPYFCVDEPERYRGWAVPVPGPLVERFGMLARRLEMAVVLPLYEHDTLTGRFHNAAVVIGPDGELQTSVDRHGMERLVTRKLHLPAGSEPPPGFDEPAHFTAGDGLGVYEVAGLRFGVLICYDRRFPECWRELRALGAEAALVPVAASGGDSPDFFVCELRTHARENGLVGIAANKCSEERLGDKRVENFGESVIVDVEGEVVARRSGGAGPGPVTLALDLEHLEEQRNHLRYFHDRRTDLFPSAQQMS